MTGDCDTNGSSEIGIEAPETPTAEIPACSTPQRVINGINITRSTFCVCVMQCALFSFNNKRTSRNAKRRRESDDHEQSEKENIINTMREISEQQLQFLRESEERHSEQIARVDAVMSALAALKNIAASIGSQNNI